jgi:CRP/FNR family transcriptional regulator, cyclic AMP receptor protein
MDRKVDLLARVPLLAGLSRKDLERVASIADQVDLPAGRAVARQGEYGSEFYVIVEGAASVERDGQHLTDLGSGAFFGELALLAHIQRTATVTTTAPSSLLVIGAREFRALLEDQPAIVRTLLQVVAERVARTEAAATH